MVNLRTVHYGKLSQLIALASTGQPSQELSVAWKGGGGPLLNIYYLLAFDENTAVDLLGVSEIRDGSGKRGYARLEKI